MSDPSRCVLFSNREIAILMKKQKIIHGNVGVRWHRYFDGIKIKRKAKDSSERERGDTL